MGLGGFAIGFAFTFLIGSTDDFPWYAPFVIGLCLTGVPFGWDMIRDKSGIRTRTIYYGPDGMLIQFIAGLIGFALKFIFAYVIGLFIFPLALLYHSPTTINYQRLATFFQVKIDDLLKYYPNPNNS